MCVCLLLHRHFDAVTIEPLGIAAMVPELSPEVRSLKWDLLGVRLGKHLAAFG